MQKHQKAILITIFSLIIFILLFGKAYQNRATITNLSEQNDKLYVALSNNKFMTFDLKNAQFNEIKELEGYRITNLLRTNKSLIVEATGYVENNKFCTSEHIYAVDVQGKITNLMSVKSSGRKQYVSSLMAADDQYIYVLKNNLDKEHHFSLNNYKYDLYSGKKIEGHFCNERNLVVQDIYEDTDYFWYACYRSPSATHWTSVKGYPVIIRRNKKNNDLKKIFLGQQYRSGEPLLISGDTNYIWLSKINKGGYFIINKNDLSYKTIWIKDLCFTAKEIPFANSQNYLWVILRGWSKSPSLHRLNKNNFNAIPIKINIGEINGYHSTIVDNHSIWIGLSQYDPAPANGAHTRVPYLLKVSKDNHRVEIIPLETSLGEGIKNIARSFYQSIARLIWGIVVGSH
jgi:hypothetical protein